MERQDIGFGQARGFVEKHFTKMTATVAGGGIVSESFLSGTPAKVVTVAGGVAAVYTVIRVWRHFAGSPFPEDRENNNESKDK